MNAWEAERAAERARLVSVLTALAENLPGGWAVEADEDSAARLVNPDGVTVWASLVTYGAGAGRLRLSAGTPDGASYSAGDTHGVDCPDVTVNPDRDPAALARDVARRLIPAAVDYWTAVSDRLARRLAAADARQTLARELADIMGGTAREGRGDRGEWVADIPDSLSNGGRHVFGELTPDYGADSVHVSLRGLSADRARELAAMIGGWK